MKMPILTIFLLFIITLSYFIKKNTKIEEKKEEEFIEKEHKANFSRKKNIDHLDYILLPENIIKIVSQIESDNTPVPVNYNTNSGNTENILIDINEACQNFIKLSNEKIINLSGITNTDLKLTYGVANLQALTEYDQNFTTLITLSEKICTYLMLLNDEKSVNDCKSILEWLIESGADTAYCFKTLSQIYINDNNKPQIHYLIKKAEKLNTLRKDSILRMLNNYLDS